MESSGAVPAETVASMVQCVASVARSPFFRYPNVRLNQINFPAELHACAASMTEDPTFLRSDYRRQLVRFVEGGCAQAWFSCKSLRRCRYSM